MNDRKTQKVTKMYSKCHESTKRVIIHRILLTSSLQEEFEFCCSKLTRGDFNSNNFISGTR